MSDKERIAKRLTKAQRTLLASLHPGDFRDWKAGSNNVRTRNALAREGLTEYYQLGGVSLFFMRRLSPLGLAVLQSCEVDHSENNLLTAIQPFGINNSTMMNTVHLEALKRKSKR